MISKVLNYVRFLKKVNVRQFFYLNYMSHSVVRMDGSKIIPYKNSVVEIQKDAKIYLVDGDIEVGCDALKESRRETDIRLHEGAIWSAVGGAKVSYGTTIEILEGALLNSKYFTMNSNSTMVVAKRIDLGQDVMMARNVILYDSDFHQITNEYDEVTNPPEDVKIGDHVWLATNCMVLKGTQIGDGCMIGANSTVKGMVPANSMYYIKNHSVVCEGYGGWKRERP